MSKIETKKNKIIDGVNPIAKANVKIDSSLFLYDAKGKENNKLELEDAIAMKIDYNNRCIYKLRTDRAGQLFNPKSSSIDKLDSLTGGSAFKFTTVSPVCFETYVNFLQKRHDSLLTLAQRATK